MIVKKALVPYSNEENKKKLEDYIKGVTGKRIDLGPIHYGGKLTIQTMNVDFSEISTTNITCAPYFPGKHFKNVDEFIEWHKSVSVMDYPEACSQVKDRMDVVALYYEEDKNRISYVCFRMSGKQSIERYLISSDGEAKPFENDRIRYCVLKSNVNGNMLMFRESRDEEEPFTDIKPYEWDLNFFRHLISVASGM